MTDTSQFQDRYHIRFRGRRTTVTLDKILSELIAMSFGLTPDRTDYHSTVQQWLQATLTDKVGVFAQTDKSDYSSSPTSVSGAGVR